MSRFADALARLSDTVAARAAAGDADASYTARLLSGGPAACGKKLGEEAIETVIAALQADPAAFAAESADLFYHWVVLARAVGVDLDAVAAVLEAREGRSGLDEKAARGRG